MPIAWQTLFSLGEEQILLGGGLGSALYPSARWKLFAAKEQTFPGALPCLGGKICLILGFKAHLALKTKLH